MMPSAGRRSEPRRPPRGGFAPVAEQLRQRCAIPLRVVMGGLRTGAQRLQRAFYVEGVDVTDLDVFTELMEDFDVTAADFVAQLHDDATIERTREDFQEAQRLGAMGFPTLLLRDRDEHGIITRGFVSWEALEPAPTSWFERNHGDMSAGLLCDPQSGEC